MIPHQPPLTRVPVEASGGPDEELASTGSDAASGLLLAGLLIGLGMSMLLRKRGRSSL